MSATTEPETTQIDDRYGTRRYGDPGQPEQPPPRQLEDAREQRQPDDDVTPREALGAGLKLDSNFDLVIENGTLATVSGVACLGRDLAFRITRIGGDLLGERMRARVLSRFEYDISALVTQDDRISTILYVRAERGGVDTVVVELALVAEDDQKHQFIINVPTGKRSV